MIHTIPDLTVQSLFEKLEEMGASKMEIVFSDGEDVPISAVIVVKGKPETGEIIEAVESVQERWDDNGPSF